MNGRHRIWNAEKVIAGLKKFYRHTDGTPGHQMPVLERDNPPLIGGARRIFGSLKAAMEAAGLPYPPRPPWTEERILDELRRMHAEGGDLSLAAVKDRHRCSLLGPALHRFGSWRKAVEAAGIDYSTVSRVREWNSKSVIEALQIRYKRGRGMGGGAIQKEDLRLWAACNRYFGSYQKAAEAARVPIPQSLPEWSWPVPRLQKALRRVHEAGVDLSSGRIRHTHPGLFYAARSRLGSWQKALESIGLDYESVRRAHDWSAQAVIEQIRELHKAGEDLHAGAVQKSHVALSGAVQRYFGTQRRAMKAAGLSYPENPSPTLAHWTEELVLKTLRDSHSDGEDLRHRRVKERRQPLYHAAKHFFGSYTNAVAQAGIDYWQMSQTQLKLEREARRRQQLV